jgi:hypothetical protein
MPRSNYYKNLWYEDPLHTASQPLLGVSWYPATPTLKIMSLKLINSSTLLPTVADRWREAFCPPAGWGLGRNSRIWEQLNAAGTRLTVPDVEELVGNETWTKSWCSCCNTFKEEVVEMFEYEIYRVDLEVRTPCKICDECITKAFNLLTNQQLGACSPQPEIMQHSAIRDLTGERDLIISIVRDYDSRTRYHVRVDINHKAELTWQTILAELKQSGFTVVDYHAGYVLCSSTFHTNEEIANAIATDAQKLGLRIEQLNKGVIVESFVAAEAHVEPKVYWKRWLTRRCST